MYGAHSLCAIRAASCYCCCCWKGTHFVWDGVPSSCNLRNFLIHRIITQVLFMGLFQNSNIPQRIQTTIYFHFATLSLFIYSKYLFLTLAYSSSSFIISASLSPYLRSVHKKWIASIMQTHHKCFSDVWKLKFYRSYHLHSYKFTSRSAS